MEYPAKLKLAKKGQVVLETALVLVAVVIMLVGIMRIWSWFIVQYTDRWQAYKAERVQAGQIGTYSPGAPAGGFTSDGYQRPDLNLF